MICLVKAVYSILKDELINHGIIGKPLGEDLVKHVERIVDSVYHSFKYRCGLNMGEWEIQKIFEMYKCLESTGKIRTDMQINKKSLEEYYDYIENNLADLTFFDGNRYEMKVQLLNILNKYESEYTNESNERYNDKEDIGDENMYVTKLNIEFDSEETRDNSIGNTFIFIDGACNLKIGRVLEVVDTETDEYLILCAHTLNTSREYCDTKYFAFQTTDGSINLAKRYVEKMYKDACDEIAYRNSEKSHDEIQIKLEKDLKEVKEEIMSMCKQLKELDNEEEDNFIFELAGLFSRYSDIHDESLRSISFTMVELNNELEKIEDIYEKLSCALDNDFVHVVENRLNGILG